jgi:hypothetical protein
MYSCMQGLLWLQSWESGLGPQALYSDGLGLDAAAWSRQQVQISQPDINRWTLKLQKCKYRFIHQDLFSKSRISLIVKVSIYLQKTSGVRVEPPFHYWPDHGKIEKMKSTSHLRTSALIHYFPQPGDYFNQLFHKQL